MNIVCVICSDLLTPSSDVFHTPCGHIFHFECLTQWLERSKTCPQCREKATDHRIHRIYFNFSNNDSIVEDASVLQQKVDNLMFQVKLKDKEISNLREDKNKAERKVAGLRMEISDVEREINSKNSAINSLKEQIKFYKLQCQDVDTHKNEVERLKKHLESLSHVQSLIHDSADEVDEMIKMVRDPAELVTYIAVMKREMKISCTRRRELRDKVNRLQQELQRSSAKCISLTEEHVKRKELEKQLIICESEKIHLQNQLHDMQKGECKVLKETSDGPQACEEYSLKEESNMKTKFDDTREENDCVIVEPNSGGNASQNVKSQGFFSMRNPSAKRINSNVKIPSILAKKPKFTQTTQRRIGNDMTFDGFGGHAKYDKFPDPVPSSHVKKVRNDHETKAKKSRLDTGDNQKLSDILLI